MVKSKKISNHSSKEHKFCQLAAKGSVFYFAGGGGEEEKNQLFEKKNPVYFKLQEKKL